MAIIRLSGSKVKINKGVGDFEMIVVKLPGSIGGFLLWFTNKNDFPASALIEVLYKKADGRVSIRGRFETTEKV